MGTQNVYEREKADLSRKGIVLPQEVLEEARLAALDAERAEREHQLASSAHKGRFERIIDGFIARYPQWQDSANKFGNLSMALIKLFSVNVFAFVILFGVSIAEIARVLVGLMAVESNPVVALILSTVLVFLVVFLGFGAYYLEREADYIAPDSYHWSLRILLGDVRYMLGLKSNNAESWVIRKKSPARIMNLAKWITQAAVSFLALYGAMFETIKGHKGTWFAALQSIFTESSLSEMGRWSNGLLVTAAILLGSAAMLFYVVSRASKLEDSEFVTGENRIEAVGYEAAADIIRARAKQIMKGRYQTQSGATLVSASDMPIYERAVSVRTDTKRIDTPVPIQGKPIDVARKWLADNPNHGLTVRKAAESAGVSAGAMQRAMKN